MEKFTMQKDKLRGSLVGGAIGDALGYPVEFIGSYEGILKRYGERGITRFDYSLWWNNHEENNKAVISDDTQMTLFTACGLLNAKEKGCNPVVSIENAYLEWYFTQTGRKNSRFDECWINEVPDLYVRRAPGNTCLTALAEILEGRHVSNNSKGCGGVMRIAPVALYGAVNSRINDIRAIDRLAADASRLTHRHPLGYIPSSLVAHVIYRLMQEEKPTKQSCQEYVEEGLSLLKELYPDQLYHVKYFTQLTETAIYLSTLSLDDASTIELNLGGGWTAEETVAIAIYCTLKYFNNFEEAMIAAVNHAGDSDSTGAVTGNILGTATGYERIPNCYKNNVELLDVILHIADDLYQGKNSPFVK